jgi:16S rRNA (cytosine967-C5)-methyltransferase
MKPGARIAAAAEILDEIFGRHRPASEALADWAKAHRFAGSGDRNAIGSLVYDALRSKLSSAWRMGSESGRALAIAAAPAAWGIAPDEVAGACDGSEHALSPLSDEERRGLAQPLDTAPDHVRANVPEWLWSAMQARFGDAAVAEGEAMSHRAPTDLRVNTLRATREKVEKALKPFDPAPARYSPVGLRIAAPTGTARVPNLQAEAAFQAGWFEIQDEGSQLAALIAAAAHPAAGQVLDLCAGGGGKTLALAAAKVNRGQIFAFDKDRTRLAPIHQRLKRAEVRNVQVRPPRAGALDDLEGRMDLVVVDAPCSGTGVWRRRPDSKWRITPQAVERRQQEQREVLIEAARYLKPGGRLAYITCSLLRSENEDQVAALLAQDTDLAPVAMRPLWATAMTNVAPPSFCGDTSLVLSPASSATDGFFVAVIERRARGG